MVIFLDHNIFLNEFLIPQGLSGRNVSSSNFQWQVLGRMKQISIFCKIGLVE